MPDSLIGIDIQGMEVFDRMAQLPREILDAAGDDLSEYLLNIMQTYPPYSYVSRTQAYGKPFASDKQRRWFFAALASGEIQVPYYRTQGLRNAWQKVGEGMNAIIVNDSPGAPFTMGDGTQARLNALAGWQTIGQRLAAHADKISKVVDGAVKRAMRKLGLGG